MDRVTLGKSRKRLRLDASDREAWQECLRPRRIESMSEQSPLVADEFRMAGAVGTPSRPHFGRDLWVFLLLVLVGFCGVLWELNRAWRQHEHVLEIGRAGGLVIYDWQLVDGELSPGKSPPWWTQAMARFAPGPDVLTRVAYVDLSEATDVGRGLAAALGLGAFAGSISAAPTLPERSCRSYGRSNSSRGSA